MAQEMDKHNVCVDNRESDFWAEETALKGRIDFQIGFAGSRREDSPIYPVEF
jgi:hypothetical protein